MPDQPAPSTGTAGGPQLAGAGRAGLSMLPSRPVTRPTATARRTLPPRAAYTLAAST